MSETTRKEGHIVGIAGPVNDAECPPDSLPDTNYALALEITLDGRTTVITAEAAQQIAASRIRALAMTRTAGLPRGAHVRNLGRGIHGPVGDATLGHVVNVIGEPLDVASVEADTDWEIRRPAPLFADLAPKRVMFETGIRVI